MPTKALYYVTRVLATKKLASDVAELREGVDQVSEANEIFKFYLYNEWVFDNANCHILERYMSKSPEIAETFGPLNVKVINWPMLAMNHAYGVKHYVLKEEAVLPSIGYHDTLIPIKSFGISDHSPWNKKVNWNMITRPTDDMKRLVLETDSVKEAIGEIVAKKLNYYRNTLQLEVDENKIY